MSGPQVGLWFLGLSALFLILALRANQRRGPRLKAWLRIAAIFGAVGLFLLWGIDRARL